jgi:signal transduction histidine kinase
MAIIKWYNHIFAKISRILLILLLLAASIQVLFFGYFWSRLTEEHNQLINFGVAAKIAEQLHPHLNPMVDHEALRLELYHLSLLFPHTDLYLLGRDGTIRFSFLRRRDLAQTRVSLGPVHSYLRQDAPLRLPLLGDNPLREGEQSIFSAAPVELAGARGYVYAVLTTAGYSRASAILRDSYMILNAIGIVALSVLISGGIGVFVFFLLTRRLARLTSVVARFEQGDYSSRSEVGGADELGALERVFNSMADALVQALDTIRANDRRRRDFVTNISHDLRTPLTSAKGCLQTLVLQRSALADEEREDLLRTALLNVELLGRMAGDLFELSRLEAKEAQPEPVPFQLAETLRRIHDKFEVIAREARISFGLCCPVDLPAAIGDEHLLSRAISNLVENALLYTGEGGTVELEARATGGAIVLEVRDSGPGIAPDELPHIFERFYRGRRSRHERPSGTGLGLAITKQIVENHGGVLGVESVPDRGTTFHFSIRAV